MAEEFNDLELCGGSIPGIEMPGYFQVSLPDSAKSEMLPLWPHHRPVLAFFKSSARNWVTSLNRVTLPGLISINVWWASRQARVTSSRLGLAQGWARA